MQLGINSYITREKNYQALTSILQKNHYQVE